MVQRIMFVLATAFFVVMNVLLWRAEYGGAFQAGGNVPVARLWELILTAPDDSSLDILHRGRRVGSVRWLPSVEESATSGSFAPEGMVRAAAGYRINVEGNLLFEDSNRRLRFHGAAQFGPDRAWQRLTASLVGRPMTVELEADAEARQLDATVDLAGAREKFTIGFDQLRNPETALRSAGLGPLAPILPLLGTSEITNLAARIHWTGSHDWLRLGESRMRVYRLSTQLPQRRALVIKLSRTGEILHVELPGQVRLANDAFVH